MGKPIHHANGSVNKFGGEVSDYLPIHDFLDASKQVIADLRHRFLTHHTFFTTHIVEKIFGSAIRNSSGRVVAVRDIAELHLLEDFRMQFMPSVQDWGVCINLQWWQNAITETSANPLHYAKKAAREFGGSYKAYLPINDLMESVRVAMPDVRSKTFTHNQWFVDNVVVAIFGEEITVPVKRQGKKAKLKVSVRDVANYHIKVTFGKKPILSACDVLSTIEPLPWMDNAKDNSLPPSQEALRPILLPHHGVREFPSTTEPEMVVDGPKGGRNMMVDGGPIGAGMRFDGDPSRYGSAIGASMQHPMMDDVVSDFAGIHVEDDDDEDQRQPFATRMYGSIATENS